MTSRGDSEELLHLAQEAGRLGIFEWHVESGDVRLSPNFLALYGLAAFCEIAGCFAFWAWLRQGRSPWLPLLGIVLLAVFALVWISEDLFWIS